MSTPKRTASARSDGVLVRRLARELYPDRVAFLIAALLYAPLTAAQVLQPIFIGYAVDRGYRTGDAEQVTLWASAFIGAVLVHTTVQMGQLFLMQRMGQRAVRRLRERLFAKLQRLPMSYFDRTPLGRVMTKVTNDTESLAELFSSGSVSIVGDILFLAATLVMLFVVDVKLSLATLLTLPVLAIGVQWFRRRTREAFSRVRAALSQMNGTLQETLSGMAVVQLFAQGPRMRGRFEKENEAYMLANRTAIGLDAGIYSFVDAMSVIAVAVAIAAGAYLQGTVDASGNPALTLGVLVLFVEALGRFFGPIREIGNKFTVIQNALVAADRTAELEEEPEPITVPPQPKPAVFARELRFDDVRFGYQTGGEVLRGLSFVVKKGERTAIVGHTGAGKTTIIKLVPRLYDVTGGAIRLDGVDVREMDPRALRRLTTAVPQDVLLFGGTLRENLAYGRPSASDEEILAAAKACQADGLLGRHGGLDGKVNERGTNLSLGERQLIALARALLADPQILILDEATASVDRDTERRLQAATETLLAGRTALIVAHRLSTIEKCDRILVLHQGQLAEQGTHDELMALGGRYYALRELQRRADAA